MTEGIVRLDSCSDLCFGRLTRHGRLASFLVQILRIQSFVLPSNDLAYHSNFGLRTHTYTEGEREREREREREIGARSRYQTTRQKRQNATTRNTPKHERNAINPNDDHDDANKGLRFRHERQDEQCCH